MVAAGTMRETVRIEKPNTTTNEFGEAEQVWECVRECRAEIVPVSYTHLTLPTKA